MLSIRIRHTSLGVALVLASWAIPTTTQADFTVSEGLDLFITQPGTSFAGVDYLGLPLGTFDFGAGAVNTGPTDTIVNRHELVLGGPGAGTIDIELVALSLKSVDVVDLGGGVFEHLFITLTFDRTGLEADRSTGEMDIRIDPDMLGGTFESFFDVFFDVRVGAIDGAVVFSDSLRLETPNFDDNDAGFTAPDADDVAWGREPPPDTTVPEIDLVNHFLNGADAGTDFWPILGFEEAHPSGAKHVVDVIPAPGALLLGSMGLGLVGWVRRRFN